MNAVVDNMEIRLRKSNYENEQFKSDLDIDKNLTYIRKDAHIKEEVSDQFYSANENFVSRDKHFSNISIFDFIWRELIK